MFNNIVLTGGPGAEEEQVGLEFGAPVQIGLIGLGFEEAQAVAVAVAVTITKIIGVCELLFEEYMFAPLSGVVLQTIIGLFAVLFGLFVV